MVKGFVDKRQSLIDKAEDGHQKPHIFTELFKTVLHKKPKIIFTGTHNLSILRGYKANVEIKSGLNGRYEVHVIMTGFKLSAAKNLVDDLEALPDAEIHGDNE